MKVIFLGATRFVSGEKDRFRVDLAFAKKETEGVGYQSLVAFTTSKQYDEFVKLKPLTEYDLALFFKDDIHSVNRVYLKKS